MQMSCWRSLTCRVAGRAWGSKDDELTTGPLPYGGKPHRWSPCWSFSVGRKCCTGSWRTCEGMNERTGYDEVQEKDEPAEAGLTRFMSSDGERA